MSKVYGTKKNYHIVKQDGSRTIVSFGIKQEPDEVHYTWHECFWYKKQHPIVTIEDVKSAIISAINAETDKKILSGHYWYGRQVWLSSENQFNYKALYDMAVQTKGASLPVTVKLGNIDEPYYKTFTSLDEFEEFYVGCLNHISETINDGWRKKDSIDWEEYETALRRLYE